MSCDHISTQVYYFILELHFWDSLRQSFFKQVENITQLSLYSES